MRSNFVQSLQITRAGRPNSPRIVRTIAKRASRRFWGLVLLSVAHLFLGLLIYRVGVVAIVHPLAVFCLGAYWAFNTKYRIERSAFAMAYIIGAEVLWRMAQVPVFWEFGKYASAVIAIIAIVRRTDLAVPKLPLLYLALLIPACGLTFIQHDASSVRAILSVQMTGPALLLVASWFFSKVKITQSDLRTLMFALTVPLLSVAFATLYYTVTTDEIQFTGESNFATSGGFGPNQVSSMLGLGVFVAIAALLLFSNSIRYRAFLLGCAGFFAAQSVMTFSRGGIYNAAGGIVVMVLVGLLWSPKVTLGRIAPVAALVVLFLSLLFPVMNRFTGGQLQERFEDTGTASRTEIAESDIALFLDNPVLGVGVGESYALRSVYLNRKAMSHTEFSRMLSEHGIFGLGALLMLVAMVVVQFKRQRSAQGRALVLGCATWCCLFMTNAGMRMAAPSLMWGLMFVTVSDLRRIMPSTRPRIFASGEPAESGVNAERGTE